MSLKMMFYRNLLQKMYLKNCGGHWNPVLGGHPQQYTLWQMLYSYFVEGNLISTFIIPSYSVYIGRTQYL